jgi:alpha-beta hydrolase superfamily lysophospholipase
LYFNAGEHLLFGWLHLPRAAAQTDCGVILCQPFGYEAICAHRGIRVFAEALAAAGFPALRFDYLGTGDSPEIDAQADQIKVWTEDVLGAAEALRMQSGVRRICLLGFRLGALLATQAAAQSDRIDGLVVVSPIVSGRRYLKELRMTRMAGSMMSDATGPPPAVEGMEVSGFVISPATLATLAKLEVPAPQSSLAPMLVIESSSTKSESSAAPASTSAAQALITRLALPGLVEMLMTAPQFAQAPKEVIEASLEWLAKLAQKPARARSGTPPSAAAERGVVDVSLGVSAAPEISLTGDVSSHHTCTERPVHFGPELSLFGVLTQPPAGEIRRRAVILLNAGADHHIGASRLYVSLARRWGQHGYTVLRMDLGGIGDSTTRPGRTDDDVFPREAIDDIRAAMDFLCSHGIRDISLAGLCSGAYHALRGAVAGLPVSRILMVNPQNYFWRRGETLQGVQLVEVVHNPGLYRLRLFSLAAWKRMISGQVNILRIIKIYLRRPLLQAESVLRDCARRLNIRLPNDLGAELEGIVARGVRVVFVFARDEPGIELLRVQAGNAIKRLGEHCHIHILEGGDHVFTRSAARAIMENIVSDELFARPERAGMTSAHLGTAGLKFE